MDSQKHKFNSLTLNDINLETLNFRPTIVQVGTYTYKAARDIAKHLQPLISENQYMLA